MLPHAAKLADDTYKVILGRDVASGFWQKVRAL